MHGSTSPVALTPSLTEKLCIIYVRKCKVSLAFRTPRKDVCGERIARVSFPTSVCALVALPGQGEGSRDDDGHHTR